MPADYSSGEEAVNRKSGCCRQMLLAPESLPEERQGKLTNDQESITIDSQLAASRLWGTAGIRYPALHVRRSL